MNHPELVPKKLLLVALGVAFVVGFVPQIQRALGILIVVVVAVAPEGHGDGAETDAVPVWRT